MTAQSVAGQIEHPAPDPEVVDDQPDERWSVLLIEEDVPDAQRVTQQLRHCGACGDLAHCARLSTALALLAAQAFDVVIADLDLQEINGRDAVERLRAAAPEAALIALRREHDAAFDEELRGVGAEHCLFRGELDQETLRRDLSRAVAFRRRRR